jgi:hypothetical protein
MPPFNVARIATRIVSLRKTNPRICNTTEKKTKYFVGRMDECNLLQRLLFELLLRRIVSLEAPSHMRQLEKTN